MFHAIAVQGVICLPGSLDDVAALLLQASRRQLFAPALVLVLHPGGAQNRRQSATPQESEAWRSPQPELVAEPSRDDA